MPLHSRTLDLEANFLASPAFTKAVERWSPIRLCRDDEELAMNTSVVVGNDSRDSWFGAAATWLVEGTGADRVELPGGHVGFVSHPQEFLELVRRIARRDSIAVAPSG
jgi:hypothetical protein